MMFLSMIIKSLPNGPIMEKSKKNYLAFSEYYKDPIPNPLTLTIDRLKPNTLYELEIFALMPMERKVQIL